MLDNSEQDLDSSYRETQDSDAEDTSSTNGSASEQNLFISLSESDSENSDIATARPESDIARFGQGQIRTGSRPESDKARFGHCYSKARKENEKDRRRKR